jgi:hypothetical protein
VPLHDRKIGVWCAITASRIIGPVFFKALLIQSGMSVTFLGPFLTALRKKERHGYFMQDGATTHTATYCINVFNDVFEDRLLSRGL